MIIVTGLVFKITAVGIITNSASDKSTLKINFLLTFRIRPLLLQGLENRQVFLCIYAVPGSNIQVCLVQAEWPLATDHTTQNTFLR